LDWRGAMIKSPHRRSLAALLAVSALCAIHLSARAWADPPPDVPHLHHWTCGSYDFYSWTDRDPADPLKATLHVRPGDSESPGFTWLQVISQTGDSFLFSDAEAHQADVTVELPHPGYYTFVFAIDQPPYCEPRENADSPTGNGYATFAPPAASITTRELSDGSILADGGGSAAYQGSIDHYTWVAYDELNSAGLPVDSYFGQSGTGQPGQVVIPRGKTDLIVVQLFVYDQWTTKGMTECRMGLGEGTFSTACPAPSSAPAGPGGEPPPAGSHFSFDYSMPDRYGFDRNHDGLIDQMTSATQIVPDHFDVDLEPPQSLCGNLGRASVKINGRTAAASVHDCGVRISVPREGTYKVKLTIPGADGDLTAEQDVVVQDWLIVSLGDSVASGEGNPDLPAGPGRSRAKWELDRCHRSALSRDSLAAEALERHDPRTSVTFVSLACSGATIERGLLGGYDGVQPDHVTQPAQLNQLVSLTHRGAYQREIDALITSVGANDIAFGPIVQYCLFVIDCPHQTRPPFAAGHFVGLGVPGADPTLAVAVKRSLARLSSHYDRLAKWLSERPNIPDPSRVYLTEYFDPTELGPGRFCHIGEAFPFAATLLTLAHFPYPPSAWGITPSESEWASNHVVLPLNAEVAKAATRHRWRYIGGVARAFRNGHGYCAGAQSYVQTFVGSWNAIGDVPLGSRLAGAVHPNAAGHLATSTLILARLTNDLYPKGEARRPGAAEVSAGLSGGLGVGGSVVPLKLSCPPGGGTCAGSVTVSAAPGGTRAAAAAVRRHRHRRSRLIGRARFRVSSGHSRRVKVRLNRRGRRLVRRERRLRITIRASARDANGTRASTTRSATLKTRGRHKRSLSAEVGGLSGPGA